jgi:excisionase family DNA binding protein
MMRKNHLDPNQTERDVYYTPEEVAELLRVKRKHVLDLLRSGRLKGVKVGKFWRIRKTDLQAFLKEPEKPD